jgi:hypothetical protein
MSNNVKCSIRMYTKIKNVIEGTIQSKVVTKKVDLLI